MIQKAGAVRWTRAETRNWDNATLLENDYTIDDNIKIPYNTIATNEIYVYNLTIVCNEIYIVLVYLT